MPCTGAMGAAHSTSIDAHNAGYYTNSYTTKLIPGLENVLQRIAEGVRRLRDEWDAEDEKRRVGADAAA